MDRQTWKLLRENFEEQEFIETGHYRLREIGNNLYEMAYLVFGPCGDKTYHPQITLRVGERIEPLKMIDTEVVPNVRLSFSDEPEKVQQALDKLTKQFFYAKKLE